MLLISFLKVTIPFSQEGSTALAVRLCVPPDAFRDLLSGFRDGVLLMRFQVSATLTGLLMWLNLLIKRIGTALLPVTVPAIEPGTADSLMLLFSRLPGLAFQE